MAGRPAPRRELWQLSARLSMTFAVAGLVLGLGGHWATAYAVFAIGGLLAAIAGVLVWRREKSRGKTAS